MIGARMSSIGTRAMDGNAASSCPLTSPLACRLFALLVLRRGDVVPADVAIDTLWPSEPPRDAAAALQNHLFRLRRGLPDGVIQSVGSGYRVDPTLLDVDADRLDAALNELGTPSARKELTAILRRWRGRAYPELEDTDAGIAAATDLDLHVRLDGPALDRKVAALRAMATQTTGMIDSIGLDVYRDFVSEEAFVDAPRPATFAELATMVFSAS